MPRVLPTLLALRSSAPLRTLAFIALPIVSGCGLLSNVFSGGEPEIKPAPQAVASDPALEAKMVETARALANQEGFSETFVSARLATTDWVMVRNSNTGTLTGRQRTAHMGATWPNGRCSYQRWAFHQSMGARDFDGPLAISLPMDSGQRTVECGEVTGEAAAPESPAAGE